MEREIKPKKVAILGAGPSGLVAAKEALANGLLPTIFEKESELGGVWNPTTGSVWDTMHTNISKFTTTYGDTPWSQDVEMFPTSKSVFEYLKSYADTWNIYKLIKFKTEVVKVHGNKCDQITGDQGWLVRWTEIGDKGRDLERVSTSEIFDGVIVATGIFAKTNIPEDIKGLDTFPGRTLHSKEYKSGSLFEGQRVLVIGGSFSGTEISGDISNHAKETIHAFRDPFWVLKRYLPDGSRNMANLPIDLVFYNRKFYKTIDEQKQISVEDQIKSKNINLLSLCQEQQEFPALRVPSDALTKPIITVISDQYLSKIRYGRIVPKRVQKISEIHGSTVKFQNFGDESELDEIDVDVIIFATGFHVNTTTIFDPEVLNLISYDPTDRLQPLVLFNATLHPDLANLFFVGMYKGPYFGVMEQQARWACRVLSQKVVLPLRNFMEEGLKKEREIREMKPRPQFPHPDYVYFADNIAKSGGSFPDLDKLQDDNFSLSEALGDKAFGSQVTFLLEGKKAEISKLFMTQPVTPAHYNLVDEPLDTLNKMRFVQQIIKQFED